jgi:hypothetical protein
MHKNFRAQNSFWRSVIISTANLHSEKCTSLGQSSIIYCKSQKKKGSHSLVLEVDDWKLLYSNLFWRSAIIPTANFHSEKYTSLGH